MLFQRLANAKLVIRPFEPADADEFVRAAHESIETVGKWMSWCSRSFTRESALGWFATGEPMIWASSAPLPASYWVAPVSISWQLIIATAISAIGYGNPAKAAASPDRQSLCCVNLAFSSWDYFGWKS